MHPPALPHSSHHPSRHGGHPVPLQPVQESLGHLRQLHVRGRVPPPEQPVPLHVLSELQVDISRQPCVCQRYIS